MSTIRVPEVVPSPEEDAHKLKNAFEGIAPDGESIIWVLGRRTATQRKKIKDAYQQLYNESLLDRLHTTIGGDFRQTVILWSQDIVERDVTLAKDALKSKKRGVKHLQVIVEIACASQPHHLVAVREAYCSLFDCSLEEDIASVVPLPQRKLMLGLASSFRYDKEKVDMDVANLEAAKLHEAVKAKQLDHDDVVHILSTRNIYQLRATFECYKQFYGNPIDQDIAKGCGSGDLQSLLKIAIWCIDTPEKHFAEVIRTSIVGLGTDEDSLNRAIVTRAEIDMKKIKEEYTKMYKCSVEEDVIGDTSGNYKHFLLTLIGAKF